MSRRTLGVAVGFMMLLLVFGIMAAIVGDESPPHQAGPIQATRPRAESLSANPSEGTARIPVSTRDSEGERMSVIDGFGSLIVEVVGRTTAEGIGGMAVQVRELETGRDSLLTWLESNTNEFGSALFEKVRTGALEVRAGDETKTTVIRSGINKLVLELPNGVHIRGIVVDDAGTPISGAKINYFSRAPIDPRALVLVPSRIERPVHVATSDSDGRFLVEYYSPPAVLGATATGYTPSALYRPPRAEELGRHSGTTDANDIAQRRVHLKMVLGNRPATLEGVVVDETGVPITQASVDVFERLGRSYRAEGGVFAANGQNQYLVTDRDGRFKCDVPRQVIVAVRSGGHVARVEELDIPAGTTESIRIELGRAGRILGIVTDAAGQGISGAVVTADASIRYGEALTSAAGSYALGTMPIGRELRVSVRARGYRPEERTIHIPDGQEAEWSPRLSSTSKIRGRVIDHSGRPLVGWHIEARLAHEPARAPRDQSRTESDGGFELFVNENSAFVLFLKEPGQWLATDLPEVGLLHGDQPPVVITVAREGRATASVVGLVRDDLGYPISGARIRLYDGNTPAKKEDSTDAGGHFRIEPLLPRDYDLYISMDGDIRSRLMLASFDLEPDQQLDLGPVTVESDGDLSVSVETDDLSQIEASRVSAAIGRLGTKDTWSIPVDDSGSARTRVPVGNYIVSLVGRDVMRVRKRVAVTDVGGHVGFHLYVGRSVLFRVRVSGVPEDAAEQDATVTIRATNGDVVLESDMALVGGEIVSGRGERQAATLTTALVPGSYSVHVATPSGTSFEGPLVVPDGNAQINQIVINVHCYLL